MKKTLVILLVLVTMLNTTVFAGIFEGDFLDPFNNELFEIVAETDGLHEYTLDFVYREMVYNEDYTQAKVEETVIIL